MLEIKNANNFRRTALGLCLIGHVAGALAVWGWVSLPGMLSVDFYDLSLAAHADRGAAIGISDRAGGYAGSAVMGVPVLLGILGLVLLVVALWRAGFVPAWVPAVLFVGTAASFVGPPTAVYFTVGTVAWLASLGYVGLKMLGMSDEEWERGEAPVRGEVDTVAEAPAA
jgi:hypothetical protein